MHISVVGLSHRTAPVEIRERLSIPEQTMETSLQSLRGNEQVLEASILSTCNRLEIYTCLLYTSPSPRDRTRSRMPSSA